MGGHCRFDGICGVYVTWLYYEPRRYRYVAAKLVYPQQKLVLPKIGIALGAQWKCLLYLIMGTWVETTSSDSIKNMARGL